MIAHTDDHAPRSTGLQHLGDGTFLHAPAARQDRDPIGRLLHLGQDVAGDEHRAPLGAERPDQLADLHDPRRIQAVGGFVQDQERRILEEGGRDPEPLLHPERVRLHGILRAIGEAHPFQHARHVGRRGAGDPREDLQVPPPTEPREQGRLLDDRTDLPDHGRQAAGDVGPQQPDRARRRPHQPQQAPDRGGLPGTVRPEEAEDTTFGHLEVETIHRHRPAAPEPAEVLAETLDLDHAHARTLSRVHTGSMHHTMAPFTRTDLPDDLQRRSTVYRATGALVLIAVWGWFALVRNDQTPVFVYLNIAVHETGHVLFRPFGELTMLIDGIGVRGALPAGGRRSVPGVEA